LESYLKGNYGQVCIDILTPLLSVTNGPEIVTVSVSIPLFLVTICSAFGIKLLIA